MQDTQFAAKRTLTRSDKAAAILLAMGKPVAGKLLKFFEEAELQTIIKRAQTLRSVPPDELEKLVAEFEDIFTEGAGLMDNARVMEGILEEGLAPDQVDGLLGRRVPALTNTLSVWERLEQMDPVSLAPFFAEESAQTVAYIVSKVSAEASGKIVMVLPGERRAEILHRAINMKPVNERVASIIEGRLSAFLSENEQAGAGGGSDKVVGLMNALDKPEVDELLGGLATISKADAEKVRPRIFLFDDLVSMPLKSRITLFNDMESDTLTMALKSAPERVREAVLSAIGARQRRMIESELGGDTPGDAKAVAAARRRVTQEAIRLAREGALTLRESEGEQQAAA
ncbi:flagellar motor switch protein FliG [Pararhizobium mangrovi]|uniref:Flagellar motor switch protein FliG n=1 Tax=Pararhizobium mangrovi TaxID=2590452 RepID=A0A506TXS6_9HYPH|nr:flagellar motor switch protein FliG [Pararhizobium mangrovi]TPW25761.1 flagellar motor switch protein FliG [Pararhizobium mangrovi]